MALIRSKGGVVLNKYLVARVFAFDDHASEARAACVAKGWDDVRRGPPYEFVRRALDLHGLWGGIRACEFSPDRGKLAVIGNNTRVAFYDVATGARKLRPKQPHRPSLPDQFAALSLSFQIGGPGARRKRASAKLSPRTTSRAAVVTPDDKENTPAPFSAEVSAAPFSAEPSGAADGSECKQS